MVVLMGLSTPDSVDVCLRHVFHTFIFVFPLNSWARGPWDLCYCLQLLRCIYGSLKIYGLTKNSHYILAY